MTGDSLPRGLRFRHPSLASPSADPGALGGEPDSGRGLVLTATGGIAMVEGDACVRQGLVMLLSTRPGERVMRPDYGCELYRLAFAPNDETTAGLAVHYARAALDRWAPRIEVLGLDATASSTEPGLLELVVEYRVRATGRRNELRLGFSLTEGSV